MGALRRKLPIKRVPVTQAEEVNVDFWKLNWSEIGSVVVDGADDEEAEAAFRWRRSGRDEAAMGIRR